MSAHYMAAATVAKGRALYEKKPDLDRDQLASAAKDAYCPAGMLAAAKEHFIISGYQEAKRDAESSAD